MAVKIEMEMPESCRECRFCKWDSKYEEYYCYAHLIPVDCTENIYEKVRLNICPLNECK